MSLSSEIGQASCKFDAECDILNQENTPFTIVCQVYRCSERHVCELGPVDGDHDGYIAAPCERDPLASDCNDKNSSQHPGAEEVCDNVDNDCDQRVDEGRLAAKSSVAIDFSASKPASDIVYALDPARSAIGLSYALDTTPRGVAANVFNFAEPSGSTAPQTAMPLLLQPIGPVLQHLAVLHADSATISLLPPLTNVVTAYLNETPARILLGSFESSALPSGFDNSGTTLSVEWHISDYGLCCTADEACAANADSPIVPIPTPFSTPPVLSLGADGPLAVYVRDPDRTADLCHPHSPDLGKPILGNLLLLPRPTLSEAARTAFPLGVSAEGRAPGVAALPSLTGNGISYGWLLAYPDARGALLISRVTVVNHALQVTAPLLTLSDSAPLHTPQLVMGSASPTPDQVIGLVTERGCGTESRVKVALLQATADDNRGVKLKLLAPLTELGGADGQHAASLAYHDSDLFARERRSWAVTYRDALGVRARILDETGIPIGNEPYLLLPGDADSSGPAPGLSIVPLRSSWFAVYAYRQAPKAQLLRMELACGL